MARRQHLSQRDRSNSARFCAKAIAIGIGSPRASLGGNFALRQLVGTDRFFAGVNDDDVHLLSPCFASFAKGRPGPLRSMRWSILMPFSCSERMSPMSLPFMALRLRQAVRQQPIRIAEHLQISRMAGSRGSRSRARRKGPLFIAAPYATKLDDVATTCYHAAPDELARLGFAIAHAIDAAASGSRSFRQNWR